LASCTTSVYVNLSKNSFLITPLVWKAGAKVLLFSEPTKLFERKFQFLCNFSNALDVNQIKETHIPYYII
ncbi:MAG: hypothetical protein IJ082_05125, partial [Prevotella sp.]|nr:hypothetical protein [Prevotella sp.]